MERPAFRQRVVEAGPDQADRASQTADVLHASQHIVEHRGSTADEELMS